MKNFIRKLAVVMAIAVGASCFSMGGVALAQEEKLKTDVKIELRGNGQSHARNVLKTSMYGENVLPTGVAALAGEKITVTVEAEEGQKLPVIMFTQQKGHWSEWQETKVLTRGKQIIKVPTIYDPEWKEQTTKGGAIYLMYPYTEKEVGKAPKVTIEGGHAYPVYVDGDNVDEFRKELKEYKKKLKENPSKYIDVVDLVNDYVILNSNMQSAEVFIRDKNQKDPKVVMDTHADRFKQYFELAGITDDNKDIRHNRNHARANIRLMQPYALAYAWINHTGFQQSAMDSFFRGDLYGWAIPHEIGHHLDVKDGYIKETTNNMWANYNQVIINGQDDRVSDAHYEEIFKKAGAENYKLLDYQVLDGLAVWWQLYLYDENYWANYNKAFREDKLNGLGLENNENMVVASSIALNADMTEYFMRHKFINENTALRLKKIITEKFGLSELDAKIKPWYMHTKAVKYRGLKFNEQVQTPSITDVRVVNNKIQVTISPIDESNQDALLGYEVFKDGVLVGFTKSNVFTTLEDNDNEKHQYKVRAVDMSFNVTETSEYKWFQGQQPYIDVIKSTIIPVGKVVDKSVTSYVYVVDADGEVMTPKVNYPQIGEVTGFHTIKYTAVGKSQDSTLKTVRFHVVSDVVYADELTPIKPSPRLTEYRVNKQYDVFESFMKVEGEGTAKFIVYVDDKKKFESKEMTKDSKDGYVKLEIPENKKVELLVSTTGDAKAIWKDAKFANIHPKKPEIKVINSVKASVANILKKSDLTSVTHVTYNNLVETVEDNVYEENIYNQIKVALKKVDGTIAVAINNYKGYDNATDIINNCVHISYTAKGSDITYYTNGDKIEKIDKSK